MKKLKKIVSGIVLVSLASSAFAQQPVPGVRESAAQFGRALTTSISQSTPAQFLKSLLKEISDALQAGNAYLIRPIINKYKALSKGQKWGLAALAVSTLLLALGGITKYFYNQGQLGYWLDKFSVQMNYGANEELFNSLNQKLDQYRVYQIMKIIKEKVVTGEMLRAAYGYLQFVGQHASKGLSDSISKALAEIKKRLPETKSQIELRQFADEAKKLDPELTKYQYQSYKEQQQPTQTVPMGHGTQQLQTPERMKGVESVPSYPPVTGWQTAEDTQGNVYYYNTSTGETTWEKPEGL